MLEQPERSKKETHSRVVIRFTARILLDGSSSIVRQMPNIPMKIMVTKLVWR